MHKPYYNVGHNVGTTIRWFIFIPSFFGAYMLMALFRYPVDYFVLGWFTKYSLQTKFILDHLYTDFICIAFAIFVSCIFAPGKRVMIAAVYMGFVLIAIPGQLKTDLLYNYYGYQPWKMPFLISCYVAAAVIPFLFMVLQQYLEKKASISADIPKQIA
jgi:hypothetical protein